MKNLLSLKGAIVLSKKDQKGIKGGSYSGNCGPQIPTCWECPGECQNLRGTGEWCCPGATL